MRFIGVIIATVLGTLAGTVLAMRIIMLVSKIRERFLF